MVEPGAINRRRAAGVLGRSKNYDGVGAPQILVSGFANNLDRGRDQKPGQRGRNQNHEPQDPKAKRTAGNWLCGHPRAKNSEISWDGIAPSRMTRQRASSSVRSTMVDATLRGEVPPSTMIAIRSSN